ncbi:Hypothetical predicted protein [Lecanosticta acicola]|uniref:WW domain-containing protein n=1 Tax=Lecanosticta acicola TaxID=111012 RepID=A0AAI8YZ08_9PEZI|nr:Hypothetical predicted protein [Lecanosticta acicola]
MAQNEEYHILGAAQRRASQTSNDHQDDQPPEADTDEKNPDAADQAEEAQDDTATEQANVSAEHGEDEKTQSDYERDEDARLECHYTWYECKCDVPGPAGETRFYWNKATNASTYVEPDDKYWIFDPTTMGRDKTVGLQEPGSAALRHEAEKPPYMGYNPAIHGDYDPNADYAKWHEQKYAQEDATAVASRMPYGGPNGVQGYGMVGTATEYTSTLGFNRFSGHAQQAHLAPERHSDSAKSGRQMNAFFDTEAAANSHDGRSLKEERRNIKYTKAEMQEMRKMRHEKKEKKRRQFWSS